MAQVAAKGGIDLINSSFQAINTGYDMGVKIRNDIIKNRIISHVFSFFSIVSVTNVLKILDRMEEKKKYKKIGLINKYRKLIKDNNEFNYTLILEVGYKVGTSGKDTRAYKYVMGFVQMSKDLSTYLNENGIIENLKTYTTILKDRVGDTYVKSFLPSITNGWTRKKAIETKSYIEEIVINQIYLLLKGLNPYDSSIFKSIYTTNQKRREQNSELQKDVVIFQYIELDSNGIRFQKILDVLVNKLDLAQNRSDNSFNLQTMMNSIFDNSISLDEQAQDKKTCLNNLSPILPTTIVFGKKIESPLSHSISSPNGASSSFSPPPTTLPIQQQQQQQQQQKAFETSSLLPPLVQMPSSPPISPLLKTSTYLISKEDKGSGSPIRNAAATLDLIKKLKQSNYQPNITIVKPFKISKLKKKNFMQDEDIDEINELKLSNQLPTQKSEQTMSNLVKEFFLEYSLMAKSIEEFENLGISNNFIIIFLNELIERFETHIDFKLLFNPSVTRYIENNLNLNFDFDEKDLKQDQNLNLNHIIDKNIIVEIVNPIIQSLSSFKNKEKINNFDIIISSLISNILISKFKHHKELNDKQQQQQQQQIPIDETSKLLVQHSIITFINPVVQEFSNYIKYIHFYVEKN
ncbi:hypothetical protein RB653_005980 [Dictyostelium firmibasis]|uniref:Uncharacterized protein n=1 Tax=Dictyostelium firmibasis TaxID=79012 RepID=A0AAN7U239_9MYCE